MTRARDVANLIGSGNYSSTTFTATAGQTVFSIAHTQNFVQVFMNGLLLDLTVDYTSNGSAVTLTSGAAVGDEIEVVAYNTFSVGDALNQAAADTRYVNTTGDTMTGALTVTGNVGIDTGTITPRDSGASTLQIGGNGTRSAIKMHTSSSGIGATDGLFLGYDSGPHFYILNSEANGDIKIGTSNSVDRLLIDASGRVTTPNQPAFSAYSTGEFNTTTNTNTIIRSLNGTYVNAGGYYATSGGTASRFTAPVAGNYFFGFQLLLGAIATTDDAIHASFWKNGSLDIYGNTRYDGAGANGNLGYSGYLPVIGVTMMPLAVNDYVELNLFSTGSIAVHNAATWSRFYGYLLG